MVPWKTRLIIVQSNFAEMKILITKRYTRVNSEPVVQLKDASKRKSSWSVSWFVYKFSLRRRTGTMCPPSENIHKKLTDKLSARHPRLRVDERRQDDAV